MARRLWVSNHEFYGLAGYDFVWQGAAALGLALVYFLFIGIAAWRYGRTYCNTVCRRNLTGDYQPLFCLSYAYQPERCVGCGLCERSCRSSCIDVKNREIDASRCVDCFSCMEVCSRQALQFTSAKQPSVKEPAVIPEGKAPESVFTRREMIAASVIAAGTAAGNLDNRLSNRGSVSAVPTIRQCCRQEPILRQRFQVAAQRVTCLCGPLPTGRDTCSYGVWPGRDFSTAC